MDFILFAWGASLLYGFYNVFGKLTTKYAIKNIWLFSFLYTFFATLITLPIAIFNNVGLPSAWGNLVISAVINALFTIFYALAISKLDVTVIGPLFNFRLAFSVLLSITILNEVVPGVNFLFIGIILIAGLFVSLDEKFTFKSFFTKSILYGVLMAFFLALHGVFINKAVAEAGYWETNLFGPFITLIILAFTFPLFKTDIQKITLKSTGGLFAMSLCLAFGDILANKAYSDNVSLSTAIISLPMSMIIVFVLAVFKPDLLEKHTLKIYIIRFGAALIMIVAALKISGIF